MLVCECAQGVRRVLKGAWVRWEQRGEKGKTWGLGTRKNALARGVGGACEGCPPLSCVGSEGLEGKLLSVHTSAPHSAMGQEQHWFHRLL